ncbi:restriction endonuclease [Rhizobium sp. WW22]|uniref:restriction endonuclease n=1 Tax=Rhizobium sp. WW22 TaxID=3389070 RepID=UPI00399B7D85
MRVFTVDEIASSDLIVDATYQGGRRGGAGDDPLPSLIGVSTGGGFRYRGRLDRLELVALTSNKRDPDWPDALDRETGIYTYYGDNKTPGRELHDTPRFGNEILQRVFANAERGRAGRECVPPILVFSSAGFRRDVTFLGLAVPGTVGQSGMEDLVALWRTRDDRRFQNYRARFTILRVASVPRRWLAGIIAGSGSDADAPPEWRTWVETGRITPLLAPRTIQHRRRQEQVPSTAAHIEIVGAIHRFFADDPHGFESCAAELVRMMLPDVTSLDVTRRSRDGGRDGVGQYRIGSGDSAILVDFAIEAKCYALNHAVGVRDMSRLISRLRHRQFGVLVTTGYVDQQAYKEIKDDQHPILVLAAVDIAALLVRTGYPTAGEVDAWLKRSFAATL